MNTEKITEKTREALVAAQELAAGKGHQEVTGIHLLAGLLKEARGLIPAILEKMGKDIGAGGVVETLYLLVAAECGLPAAIALIAWFGWHAVVSLKAAWRLRGTEWQFVPAGLAGGISANALQGTLDWALRQPINLFLLGFCFAMAAYLRKRKRLGGAREVLA